MYYLLRKYCCTKFYYPGVPTDAPKNISWRFQTPDVVEIVYDSPPEHARNGQITKYEIQFWKGADPNQKKLRQTTEQKTVRLMS